MYGVTLYIIVTSRRFEVLDNYLVTAIFHAWPPHWQSFRFNQKAARPQAEIQRRANHQRVRKPLAASTPP